MNIKNTIEIKSIPNKSYYNINSNFKNIINKSKNVFKKEIFTSNIGNKIPNLAGIKLEEFPQDNKRKNYNIKKENLNGESKNKNLNISK